MHPVLFTVPGTDTDIQAYGFFVAVALIVGWMVAMGLARADRLNPERAGTAYVLAAGVGLFGARALWSAQHPDAWSSIGAFVALQAGGMSVGGGVLLGAIVTFLYTQTRKIPWWAWLDCLVPALLVAVIIERGGAFLAGSDFGTYVGADFSLGVQFPADSPAHAYQRRVMSQLSIPADASLPVHPTQLYAMVLGLGAVAVSFWARRRRVFSGQAALAGLAAYAVARMAIEDSFRVDASPIIADPIRLGQVAGILLAGIAMAVYASRKNRERASPTTLQQWHGGPWSLETETKTGP